MIGILFRERTLQSVTANTKQDGLDLLEEAAAIPIRTSYPAFQVRRSQFGSPTT